MAVRLEPIILELEREQNDLLIIAHESVLRVLYAYLMHCSTMDIPYLKFPRQDIIEVMPKAYQNEAKRIHIPLPNTILPRSPDVFSINARQDTPKNLENLPSISGLNSEPDSPDEKHLSKEKNIIGKETAVAKEDELEKVSTKGMASLGEGIINDDD